MLPAVEHSQRVARLVVWRVRPLSVARLTLLLSLCVVVIVLALLTATWLLLRRLGGLHALTHRAGALGIHVVLHGGVVLRTAVLVGIGLTLLATLVAWIASLLFNLAANLTGGVEVSVGERE